MQIERLRNWNKMLTSRVFDKRGVGASLMHLRKTRGLLLEEKISEELGLADKSGQFSGEKHTADVLSILRSR